MQEHAFFSFVSGGFTSVGVANEFIAQFFVHVCWAKGVVNEVSVKSGQESLW